MGSFNWGPVYVTTSFLGSFVIFQGIMNSIAKKPYIFVIFQGRSRPPPPPPPPPRIHACDTCHFDARLDFNIYRVFILLIKSYYSIPFSFYIPNCFSEVVSRCSKLNSSLASGNFCCLLINLSKYVDTDLDPSCLTF